jgi:hypothetical protein
MILRVRSETKSVYGTIAREQRGDLCLQLGRGNPVKLRHTLNRAAFDLQTGCWPVLLYSNTWAVGQSKLEYFADCLEH